MIPAGPSDTPRSAVSPDEVVRRLPPGVDYTFVKTIVFDAPIDPMTTLLLRADAASSPMARILREGSYGKILEAIAAEEAQVRGLVLLGDASKRKPLEDLAALRLGVYRSLTTEPALAKQGRAFKTRIRPSGFDADGSPLYIHPPVWIEVWTVPKKKGRRPRLLGKHVLPSGEQGPEAFNRAFADLLKRHCSLEELRRLRFCSTWRTRRGPEAWPAVTRRLVPLLYDYLRPYYRTRRYTRSGNKPGPGAFPRRLMDDIADILRMELPHLCGGLTSSRVLAAVRRYTSGTPPADPKRPMGEAMFRVASGNVSNSVKKGGGTER